MSTQQDSGIEFSIIPEEKQEHFRLLELPADLLNILTTENPPILQLKSREGSSGDINAVLCTPDKTYNLRQVSTSNTVFLTLPSATEGSEDGPVQTGLQAIAQSQSTLEALLTTNLSAVPYIKAALPAYTSSGHYSSKDAISKEELFTNIPLSDGECEIGWKELACFELNEGRHSVIPSDSVKLNVWKSLLGSATAAGKDVTQPLDERSLKAIINLGNDWPDELSGAVIRSMATSVPESAEIQLDDQTCAKNVGRTLLKDRADDSSGSIPVAVFKSEWADLLPEKWRALADVSLLDGYYSLEGGGQNIMYVDGSAGVAGAANGTAPAETKSTLGAKRKWHEKFRASKKAS